MAISRTEILDRGRAAFERNVWADVYTHLSAADRESSLEPDDLERLAVAAQLVGEDDDCAEAWERAHHQLLDHGEVTRAVRCAFWLARGLLSRGEMARGGGWLARAQRLLEDHEVECPEQGYLLVPMALRTLEEGDAQRALGMFRQAAEQGDRFGEPDLATLGRLGQGRSLIRMGRSDEGLSLLDEAMVAVTSEEVSAIVAGTVYCAVILTCREVFDLRRAHEWTEALSDWCDAQPGLVPFRGQCLVHRSEIMQLHGAWPEAMDEAQRARERLSDPPSQPAVGLAHYQLGELYRLRGEFNAAEEAYRDASQWGREPYPGLAQLRLAQGRVAEAEAALRRVVDEVHDPGRRARMLGALVEIMLAAGDRAAARESADELAAIAADLDAPLVHAMSASAAGEVLFAEGDTRGALKVLRQACAGWRELEAPYEDARTRLLLGLVCRDLGDGGTAELEVDAARQVFQRLGAAPDLARVETLLVTAKSETPGGLTAREVEVLALVAEGRTNRQIAAELVVSEHTIRRHLQNVFAKIGVSSRAAATAYAMEHELI